MRVGEEESAIGSRRPRHCTMRVREPWRWGTGPFGMPFLYPVHDHAIRVLGSETKLCRQKIKEPRGIAAVSQVCIGVICKRLYEVRLGVCGRLYCS